MAHSRANICTSELCPMAAIMAAMPTICEPAELKADQKPIAAEDRAFMEQLAAVKPYPNHVWGAPKWTALESEILSLPDKVEEHEFCTFKAYLALNARYMPCSNCAFHFEQHLRAMPNDDAIRTRGGLLKWLVEVKNDVNRRRHVPQLSRAEIVSALQAKSATAAAPHGPLAPPVSPGVVGPEDAAPSVEDQKKKLILASGALVAAVGISAVLFGRR